MNLSVLIPVLIPISCMHMESDCSVLLAIIFFIRITIGSWGRVLKSERERAKLRRIITVRNHRDGLCEFYVIILYAQYVHINNVYQLINKLHDVLVSMISGAFHCDGCIPSINLYSQTEKKDANSACINFEI